MDRSLMHVIFAGIGQRATPARPAGRMDRLPAPGGLDRRSKNLTIDDVQHHQRVYRPTTTGVQAYACALRLAR